MSAANDESLPRRGFVGLQLAMARDTAPAGQGLYVRGVAKNSAAERAGARAQDRLLALDGRTVEDFDAVRHRLREYVAGNVLSLRLLRAGQILELQSQVYAYPREQHAHAEVCLDQVRVGATRLRTIALLPQGPGPHPVVYYLPGAHWASEEYPFAPEHPVPALLGELSRLGIASLRVERFGMGDSDGPACNHVDFETEYAGYLAGLTLLSTSSWCDPKRVALFGHSLGACVAPLLCTDPKAAVTPAAILTFGASAIPISTGLTGALKRYAWLQPGVDHQTVAQQCELLAVVVSGKRTPEQALAERPDLAGARPEHFTNDTIYRRDVRFYHQLEAQPLRDAWGKVNVPVVAMHGAFDWICTLDDSRVIAELAAHGEVVSVDGTDHQLAWSDGSAVGTPSTLSQKLAPALKERVSAALTRLLLPG